MPRPIKQKYKLSETFNAPLDYVFKWCTDFREDDNKMIGSKTERKILEKSPERVIWRVRYKDGKGLRRGREGGLAPPARLVDARHLRGREGGRRVQAKGAGKDQDQARHEVRQ